MVVTRLTEEKRNGRPVWMCVCDCGVEKGIVSGSLLKPLGTRSCGCQVIAAAKKSKYKDLAGHVFGRLTVVSFEKISNQGAIWNCICDCGTETTATTGALNSQHKQSCGCLLTERSREATTLSLQGMRFGRLTVLSKSDQRKRNSVQWNCVCDCGNSKVAIGALLKIGQLVSCGCALLDKPGLRAKHHRESGAVHSNLRRARIIGAGGEFTAEEISDLHKKQRGRCAGPRCGVPLKDAFHRDHKTPLSGGGSNAIENIELLCSLCNLKKNAKDPVVWAQMNGMLI